MATPYDGKVGIFHVSGAWIGEATIDDVITNVKASCPVADMILVKTSNDVRWEGQIDTKASMKIDGPASIATWVSKLQAKGLEFHAWCVVTGMDIAGETARIVEACSVPGVKSMILDVEPYSDFWQGSAAAVAQLMSGVRSKLGPYFHIGICVDPRAPHYAAIYPDAWRPYVNSVHPQIYWEAMGRTPEDVIAETYVVWGGYGLPIVPLLQGWAEASSVKRAGDIVRSVRGAPGVNYFRHGVISPMQYSSINQEFVGQEVGPDTVLRSYSWEQIIGPGEGGYMDGTQNGQPTSAVFQQYTSARGQVVKYKPTTATQDTVWAQWNPQLPGPGLYEVSVYVPARHATSTKAQYHMHGISGAGSELLVRMNQSLYNNMWVPLVVYQFTGVAGSGQVNLTDLTGEPDREVAFTAVRWRKVTEQNQQVVAQAGGFDPPVGTAAERMSSQVWPGKWYDATGYGSYYTAVGPAYHTGADLNLPSDADKDTPVYATAAGTVIFSGRSVGTWGQLVVVRHDPLPDGTVVWSRYAHVETRMVKEGDRVERGQQISQIGNADGQLPFHLHFDIAKTSILESNPGHWPGTNLDAVLANYADPRQWVIDHRPPGR